MIKIGIIERQIQSGQQRFRERIEGTCKETEECIPVFFVFVKGSYSILLLQICIGSCGRQRWMKKVKHDVHWID